eukprot:TRINITY_DN35175_c0_g1_i1.p1 TRINITY_DN35175_c0_g1~~TRINITY_DN35175_c0_g1_i1.p1  ORF type:complete len:440 (+),score=95.60 TRINITY_DN35175_c0_g1_i1:95-1414(+)
MFQNFFKSLAGYADSGQNSQAGSRRVRDRDPSLAPLDRRREQKREVKKKQVQAQVDNATIEPSANSADTKRAEATSVGRNDPRQQGTRPNRPGYHETPLLSVGKEVRLRSGDICHRALIECVNIEEATVDVSYSVLHDGGSEEKEETFPSAQVQPLEDFEIQSDESWTARFAEDLYGTAAAVKDHANALFKIKDYAAAVQMYGRAIEKMKQFQVPSAGAECWVIMNHGGALVLGSVRSVDQAAAKADVALYQGDVDQLQVFRGAPWRVLIPVHEDALTLNSTLYTNRAKSLVQLGCHQDAAQDLTIAVGLWAARDEGARRGGGRLARQLSSAEVAEQQEQLVKIYYLRARTRLARMKLESARRDLIEAQSLNPAAPMAALLQQLERDIELAQREQTKSNKRIAKEVAKWADKAITNLDPAALLALDGHAGEEETTTISL